MKRTYILLAAVLLCGGAVRAQSDASSQDGSVARKMAKFWQQVKDEVTYTADGLFSKKGNYKVLVDGSYYMPVYDTNLYKGKDGREMRDACGTQLLRKYPSAEIVTCVIPQTDWLTETEESGGKVEGYKQTLYCYVVAKDGSEGYINQRYIFVRTRKVGQDYVKDSSCWAKLQDTSVMTNDVYNKVKKQKKKK